MIREYSVQEHQSIYDIVLQLYGDISKIDKFIEDNKVLLTDGFGTILAGLTVSWDDEIGVPIKSGVASYDNSIDLGTQPIFVTSVSFSANETYDTLSFSTTTMNDPYGLYLSFSILPATASDPSLTWTNSNDYIQTHLLSSDRLVPFHNGTSSLTLSADDRDGVIFQLTTYNVENQRNYRELVFEYTKMPAIITSMGLTYSLFHGNQDDLGTYDYNDGLSNTQWVDNGVYPLPDKVWVPGLFDWGILNDPINQQCYASYSQAGGLLGSSHTDQWLHMTFKNEDLTSPGMIEFGIGDYISMRHDQGTISIFSIGTGDTTEFSMGEYKDVKFNDNNQYINIDLLFNTSGNYRLIVNGKVTVVNGLTYSPGGTFSINLPSSSVDSGLYITNVDTLFGKRKPRITVDDTWYVSLTSAGVFYDSPSIVDLIRDYLDVKHPPLS